MKKLAFYIILTAISPMGAQEKFASLEEVLDYADKHSSLIGNAGLQEAIGEAGVNSARGALLPQVNGSAGYTDNITLQPTLVPANLFDPTMPAGTYNEFTFGRQYLFSTGIQANWDVVDIKNWAALRSAEARKNLDKANTAKTKFELYNSLTQVYYSILLNEKYEQISIGNLASAREIYNTALAKYNNGVITKESLNKAEIQLLESQNSVERVRTSIEEQYLQLQGLLDMDTPFVLLASLEPNVAIGTVAINGIHPDIAVAEAQTRIARSSLAEAEALRYPSLSIVYQYNHNWATDTFLGFENSNELPQQLFGLKIAMPIFNGFSIRNKITQARLAVQQEQTHHDAAKVKSAKEDERLLLQLAQSQRNLQAQTNVLALQQESDMIAASRYLQGITTLEERLDKLSDLLSAQNDYMLALSNYYLSYYRIYIRSQLIHR